MDTLCNEGENWAGHVKITGEREREKRNIENLYEIHQEARSLWKP